jgi:undecaprenyl-diphosphatase
MKFLKEIDTWLLLQINGFHFEWLDFLMYHITLPLTWLPFYILIICLLIKQYKKNAIWIIVFAFITMGICDLISVHLFKNVFQRYRPCHNLHLQNVLHIVNNTRGGLYSFVSGHAANSFGILFFLTPMLRIKIRALWYAVILWAVLLSFSRIYMGVHYPFDVLGGAILGSLLGLCLNWILLSVKSDIKSELI